MIDLDTLEQIVAESFALFPNKGEVSALRREAHILEDFLNRGENWEMAVPFPTTAAHFLARGAKCFHVVHALECASSGERSKVAEFIKKFQDDDHTAKFE
jgi:hypothetical protein